MWPAVIAIVGPIIAQILAVLGIGLVTYSGTTVVLDQLKSLVVSSFQGLPADAIHVLGLFGADQYVSIMLSAAAAKLALQSVRSSVSIVKK